MKRILVIFNEIQDLQNILDNNSAFNHNEDLLFNTNTLNDYLLQEVSCLKNNTQDLNIYSNCLLLLLYIARLNGISIYTLINYCKKTLTSFDKIDK